MKYAGKTPLYHGEVEWVRRRWYHRFTTMLFTDDPTEVVHYWTPYSW